MTTLIAASQASILHCFTLRQVAQSYLKIFRLGQGTLVEGEGSTVYLLVKIDYFIKIRYIFSVLKNADLN
jgi:hypothetical protein